MLALAELPAGELQIARMHALAAEARTAFNIPNMAHSKCEDEPYPECARHRLMGWTYGLIASGIRHLRLRLEHHATICSFGVLVAESVWHGETHPQLALWERIVAPQAG